MGSTAFLLSSSRWWQRSFPRPSTAICGSLLLSVMSLMSWHKGSKASVSWHGGTSDESKGDGILENNITKSDCQIYLLDLRTLVYLNDL